MKPRPLHPHHNLEELENFYRSAENPVERSRWHILWLKKKGLVVKEIISVTGFAEPTIRALFSEYNKLGEKAIQDKRKNNGAVRKLTKEQESTLNEILKTVDSDGDWTSEKVRETIKERFNIEVTRVCAWWYIRRLGYTRQIPRPKHPKSATEQEKEQFIKK